MAHVVFVGLGFGGLYALRKFLDDRPEGVRVTAIDRRDRFVFTPLLYEYLAGELDPDVVAPRLETLVPEGEAEMARGEVSAVDVRAREVRLAGGRTIGFDVLVLAPGSVPAFHGVKGAEQHGLPFYSFEDAERLRTTLRVRAWAGGTQPACVVGGGVVGIELAFALSELLGREGGGGEQVVVLEALGDILGGMSDGLRKMAWSKLRDAGIRVRTDVRVLEVDDLGVTFREGGKTERFDAAVVAWTAGIQPSPLLRNLPAEWHGRHGVRVERTLQLPGYPYVFVLGDAISYPGRAVGSPIPDTAQAALQQADVCAANVRDWLTTGLAQREYRLNHQGDFLRVSRGAAIADVRGVVLDGLAAALARRAAYVVRLPDWAVRTTAIRQWLGPGPEEREEERGEERRAA